jgi:hypothetical protein
MESRDFAYLQEAYQEIYQLDEEVEIATEYFYEMGLDKGDVEGLIEEVGVEEFVEWVYDIAESYILTEARAGGSRIEPVTKSGKSIGSLKGGAKSAAIARLRREKAARREAEERASAERPSGMKAALRSQATKAAKQEQPKAKKETPTQTKKGIAGAIEWAKNKAQQDIASTRKGLKTLGDTWQSVSDTKAAQAARVGAKKGSRFLERHGKTLGGAAGRAAAQNPAVVATFRAGQRLRSAMQKEDYEFESWVEGLWEEGYDLSDYTWEGLYEAYIDESKADDELTPLQKIRKRNKAYAIPGELAGQQTSNRRAERGSTRGVKKERGAKSAFGTMRYVGGPYNEEVDSYNTIADYLLDEGYAHDLESADAIIASMSEEWIMDILEGFVSPYEGKPSYNDKWGYSPAMRAFRKSEELQKTEPGSKRQKMQTKRSQQLNRTFQAARRA